MFALLTHHNSCESRRCAARGDISIFTVFRVGSFSFRFQHFQVDGFELSHYLLDECSDLCIERIRERPQQWSRLITA